MLQESFLQYFLPSLSYHLYLRHLLRLLLSGGLTLFSCPLGSWVSLWNFETIRGSLMKPNWQKLASLVQEICTLWFQFFGAVFASKGYPFKNLFYWMLLSIGCQKVICHTRALATFSRISFIKDSYKLWNMWWHRGWRLEIKIKMERTPVHSWKMCRLVFNFFIRNPKENFLMSKPINPLYVGKPINEYFCKQWKAA